MRTIAQGLGFEKTVTLAEVGSVVAKPKTIKKTPEVERVSSVELEYAYIKHPIVFNAVNKLTQSIMSAGWELRATDEKVLDFFKNFIENIGEVGEDVTFEEILESLFQYQMIYGNAYLETVLGKHTKNVNNIVDLVILDPKRMDYAKLDVGTIALDAYGKPVGYTQIWPSEVSTEGKGDPIPLVPEGVTLEQNQIFLLPPRICQFKYYEYGDRFYGMGIIEAAYQSILYDLALTKSHTNSNINKGDAPIIDRVGDTFHEPTPPQIQNALENLKQLSSNKYLALPYWHNLEPLNIKPNTVVSDNLEYIRENIFSSLGMPGALASGSGEKTNRATLATQLLFLTFSLNNFVETTLATLHKCIFKRICEYQEFKEIPEIVWGHIAVEEINDKAKRISDYIKSKALNPNDEGVRRFIKRSERLEDTKSSKDEGSKEPSEFKEPEESEMPEGLRG